jgi:hypothetical protein
MPATFQPKHGQKVRNNVIGKPDALQDKQSSTLKKIQKAIEYQEVRLAR